MSMTEEVVDLKLPPRYQPKRFLEMLFDPIEFLAHAPERYPQACRFQLLHHKVYVVHEPELVQYVLQENHRNFLKGQAYEVLALLLGNGLINSEGDFWKRQRRLAQPAFHRKSLARVADIVNDCTMDLLKRWKKQQGETVNFTREMAALTIEIVSRALFTSDVTAENINTVWQHVNYLNDQAIRMIRNPLAMPWWMPLPAYVKGRKAIADLDEIVYGIINQRKLRRSSEPDLLQLLLEAKDEDTGERMTDQQLRDEVMTIFLAGHETTVNALSWTWYLLKQNEEAEQNLKAEANYSRDKIAFEDIAKLKWGQQVMNESMRLYPPVYSIGRKLLNDDTLGKFFTPQKTRLLINIIGLHHHPKYWKDPWKFDPARFENFESKGENRFVFIPFGAGPRMCIGNNFAMMEMQIINALFARHVDIDLISKDVKPVPQITLKPGNGIMMRIKKVNI